MSIALLFDLQKEVRRLSIAGSELAIDDFALKRILPGLKKTGETVAVFGRISGCLEKLLNSQSDTSAENLIELATIINAVLYTQCQWEIPGEITDIEITTVSGKTSIPFRRLKPVVEALTSKGLGRLEIINKAYEDGVFKDIRLVLPAIEALGDSYVEIADFVQNKVLPDYGQDILPILEEGIDLEGGKLHSRRIETINKIGGEAYKELYLKALNTGSVDVKMAAINALKDCTDSEEILLLQCNDKKKEVREAAYYALAEKDSPTAAKALIKAFNSKDIEMVLEPIKLNNSITMSELLVLEGESILKDLNIEKSQEKSIRKFLKLLNCMQWRTTPNIFEFLKESLLSSEVLLTLKVDNSVCRFPNLYKIEYLSQAVAYTIKTLQTKEALQFLDSTREIINNQFIDFSFEAAIKSKSAEYVFDNYSKFVALGKKSLPCKQILNVMKNNAFFSGEFPDLDLDFFSSFYKIYDLNNNEKFIKANRIVWDKRWLKLLIDIDEEELVFKFATEDNNDCTDYLLKKLSNDQRVFNTKTITIILGLAQAKYPNIDTVILNLLKSNTDNIPRIYYSNLYTLDILKLLSPAYAGDIEETANNINASHIKEKLTSIADYVRSKPINIDERANL